MKKGFIYWVRWIAVLPGAFIIASLSLVFLHMVLYFSLAHGEMISGVDIVPIERMLTPLVFSFSFILGGFYIAPIYKFKTSIALTILFLIVWFYLWSNYARVYQYPLEASGILALLGPFLGLYFSWIKSKGIASTNSPHDDNSIA